MLYITDLVMKNFGPEIKKKGKKIKKEENLIKPRSVGLGWASLHKVGFI